MMLYINFILIFFSMLLFSMYFKHFLMTLISLEFFVMSIMYNMYVMKLIDNNGEFLIVLFMIMAVCESVIGMMIIVNFIRILGLETYMVVNQIN